MLLAALAMALIEVGSGRVLEQSGDVARRVAPGSTIKPFVLTALGGRIAPEAACGRRVRLAGRRMDCIHPRLAAPLSSREALAYSCNFYFAKLAEQIDPKVFESTLRGYGFVISRSPESLEERRLAALGEFGIAISPLDLARAYARLGAVPGLREAVEAGTAQRAAIPGVPVAGKTGTTRGHGWFAGYAPADRPGVAIVVLTAEGSGGASAAPEAAKVLQAWFARRP